MQLHPKAYLYFALRGLVGTLLCGLLIGAFLGPVLHPTPAAFQRPAALHQVPGSFAGNRADFQPPVTVNPNQPVQAHGYVNWPAFIIMGVFGFMGFPFSLAYGYFLAKSYHIELGKDGVKLHYGLLRISNEILLYEKIQDVVISQGILERLLSLSTLTIQNAMGKPENIPGLDAMTADKFRDDILNRRVAGR